LNYSLSERLGADRKSPRHPVELEPRPIRTIEFVATIIGGRTVSSGIALGIVAFIVDNLS